MIGLWSIDSRIKVNVWALLERDYGWRPFWVKADHNLSIFPVDFD